MRDVLLSLRGGPWKSSKKLRFSGSLEAKYDALLIKFRDFLGPADRPSLAVLGSLEGPEGVSRPCRHVGELLSSFLNVFKKSRSYDYSRAK